MKSLPDHTSDGYSDFETSPNPAFLDEQSPNSGPTTRSNDTDDFAAPPNISGYDDDDDALFLGTPVKVRAFLADQTKIKKTTLNYLLHLGSSKSTTTLAKKKTTRRLSHVQPCSLKAGPAKRSLDSQTSRLPSCMRMQIQSTTRFWFPKDFLLALPASHYS